MMCAAACRLVYRETERQMRKREHTIDTYMYMYRDDGDDKEEEEEEEEEEEGVKENQASAFSVKTTPASAPPPKRTGTT